MKLLEAVRQGDPNAREQWVAEWWPRVYRMALALTRREADAEDLAQETMMAALGALERYREEAKESTWLYAILVRRHRAQLRRPETPRAAAAQERTPQLDRALDLLADLPDAQRITATLFYVEDLSVQEIARALSIPQATVKWRLFWARRTLRRAMEGTTPEAEETRA